MKPFLSILTLVLFVAFRVGARADDLQTRIYDATHLLEKRQGSADPIPTELLANAKGVAICTITKAGIGIGGQGGEGIVMVRHIGTSGVPVWRAPAAFNISGASIGAQLGYSIIRYIILLNTEAAVGQFVGEGKMKWDATAMGTAGGDTGVESETTRELEKRAVVIYRESGGIFGGATLGGSSIEVKDTINQAAYGPHVYIRDILEGRVQIPQSAQRLYYLLDGKR